MPSDGPPQLHLGDHRRLGPDPEPLGPRFEVLMDRERAAHPGLAGAHRRQPRPHRSARALALR